MNTVARCLTRLDPSVCTGTAWYQRDAILFRLTLPPPKSVSAAKFEAARQVVESAVTERGLCHGCVVDVPRIHRRYIGARMGHVGVKSPSHIGGASR